MFFYESIYNFVILFTVRNLVVIADLRLRRKFTAIRRGRSSSPAAVSAPRKFQQVPRSAGSLHAVPRPEEGIHELLLVAGGTVDPQRSRNDRMYPFGTIICLTSKQHDLSFIFAA